jgi:hypothetical protein
VNPHAGVGEVGDDKAWLVGVIMGDASVYQTSDGRKLLSLNVADKEFATRFGRVFCSLTGLNWSGFEDESTQVTCVSYEGKQGNHSDTYEVSKSIAPVYEHLNSYQNPNPNEVMEEFEECYPWLLRGLWDAEGSIDTIGHIGFVNTDEDIKEIYVRLLEEVFDTSRDTGDIAFKTDSQGQDSIVRLSKQYINEFLFVVNPTIERKRYRLEKQSDFAAAVNLGE